jgi:sterol desaturase/sphingolipid hydroxylase (fatty acid hydroxylase superfamily)
MIALAVALVVLGLGFGVVEWRWPAVAQRRWRSGMVTDLIYWFFTPLVSRVLAVVAVVVVAVAIAAAAGVPLDARHVTEFARRSRWFGELPVAVQALLVLAIGDFLGYWMHRAFHRGRLWRFHAIHHSSRELDWLSATRLHPVNDIAQRALQAIPLIALGFDARVVAAFVPLVALYAIMLHANVRWTFGPLRYVIASPAFHRWHHTSEDAGLDKNFAGLFPIWDLVFGTYYLPAHQPTRFGVADPVPEGIAGQLVWPFRG